MITAMKINNSNYKFKTGNVEDEINGLNKINIFVGQNNSGKSRFMRSLFSKKNEIINLTFRLKEIDNYNYFVDEFKTKYQEFGYLGLGDIDQWIPKLKKILYIESNTNLEEHKHILKAIKSFFETHGHINRIGLPELNKILIKYIQGNNIDLLIKTEKFKVVYIPLLRGLKNPLPNKSDRDFYMERTIFDYYLGEANRLNIKYDNDGNPINLQPITSLNFEIFTGLSLYKKIREMLLGTHEEREIIKNFESFLSKNFFQNELVTIIPNINDDVLYIDIGKVKNRAIYDLGDGLQSIIINTFSLFLRKDENLILFIEEPEMGIHPGMQRILLETFAKGVESQKGEHQIFFTTHSNHFLDISLDKEINEKVTIYQFRENEEEKSITNIGHNKEILDLLGVRNSSIFLSNCIIWVEGISDRIYIKKFLELYQQNIKKTQSGSQIFEDDKHYSILEYGGGNITHFNFGEYNDEDEIQVDFINKNNFIISDNDGLGAARKKQERIKLLKVKLGADKIYCNFPEIENLLTYKTYIDYFSNYKGKNWELKTSGIWTEEKYKKDIYKKDIGKVLKEGFITLKNGIKNKKFKEGNDISIIGKKSEIAERMVELIESYSDMSDRAKILSEKIYKFIKTNNS